MATIKIKFKTTLTLTSDFDFFINFTSNSTAFTRMKVSQYISYNLNYGTTKVYDKPTNSWVDTAYQIIEIDTNQNEFNAFITAMKSNIEGVELEAGTYKWIDEPSANVSSDLNNKEINFNFHSSNLTFNKISFDAVPTDNYLVITYDYEGAYYGDNEGTSWEQQYQTITTTENQYVDYDFYNYAILGNQLVKQQPAPTPTAIKLFYHNNKLVSSKGKLLH